MTALEVTDTFDWSSSGVSRLKILKVKDEDGRFQPSRW